MSSIENKDSDEDLSIPYSIAPWLSVRHSLRALDFYKSAFGAVETYHLDVPDGVIARLSIHGAEFWLSDGAPEFEGIENLGGSSVRIILTVPNPDEVFKKVVEVGGTVVFPVGEDHGWRLGRLVDPFGLHWEIGKPLNVK